MTTIAPNDALGTGPLDPSPVVVRIEPELRLAAAARLVSDQSLDPMEAARRFLESAKTLKIDLSLMWGTLAPNRLDVRQVCLAVVGTGRTAMLFVSGPTRPSTPWFASARRRGASTHSDAVERLAVVNAACAALSTPGPHAPRGVLLAQALLESREKDAAAALRSAGFTQLGELAYMRLDMSGLAASRADFSPESWDSGLTVRSVADLQAGGMSQGEIDQMLRTVLERTYVDTLDCPELCGMRDVSDVLDSHRAVGVHDPNFWWVLSDADGPQGCALFSVCPEQDSIELVYLGVAPTRRGQGLGRKLFRMGLGELCERALRTQASPSGAGAPTVTGLGGLTCAVDTRNKPAVALYKSLGFQRFATRVPMVKSLKRA